MYNQRTSANPQRRWNFWKTDMTQVRSFIGCTVELTDGPVVLRGHKTILAHKGDRLKLVGVHRTLDRKSYHVDFSLDDTKYSTMMDFPDLLIKRV